MGLQLLWSAFRVCASPQRVALVCPIASPSGTSSSVFLKGQRQFGWGKGLGKSSRHSPAPGRRHRVHDTSFFIIHHFMTHSTFLLFIISWRTQHIPSASRVGESHQRVALVCRIASPSDTSSSVFLKGQRQFGRGKGWGGSSRHSPAPGRRHRVDDTSFFIIHHFMTHSTYPTAHPTHLSSPIPFSPSSLLLPPTLFVTHRRL